jgi:hypothetical protein
VIDTLGIWIFYAGQPNCVASFQGIKLVLNEVNEALVGFTDANGWSVSEH